MSVTWPDPERAARLLARVQEIAEPRGWSRRARGEPALRAHVAALLAQREAVALPPETEAVRALLLGAADWEPGDEPAALLVSWWAASGGVAHAVSCAVRTLDWEVDGARVTRRAGWGFDPDALGLWHALRRLSLSLGAEDHAAMAARAAAERGDLVRDCALAYALPSAPQVVGPAGRALLAALASWQAQPLLHGAARHGWCVLASLTEPELALQIATHVGAYPEAAPELFAGAILERLGADDGATVLARLFEGVGRAAGRRRLAEAIAGVETLLAARWLARHVAHPQASGIAAGWLRAHVELARPALAEAAGGRKPEPAAVALLAQIVQQHGAPEGLKLPAAVRAKVASAPEPPRDGPVMDDAELPEPWPRWRASRRKLPSFVATSEWPPLHARSGARLSPAATATLLRGIAEAAPDVPAEDVERVRAFLDPDRASRVARALLDAWLGAGAPARESWPMLAAGILAPEGAAGHLARLVDAWAREGRGRRAVLGLEALGVMGTDAAVFALQRLAAKAPVPSVAERAAQLVEEAAEQRGVDADTLEELVLPSFGLAPDARIDLDYGRRRFRAGFDERGKAIVTDAEGRTVARLPPAAKADDAAKAQQAQERWRDVRAAGEYVLARQSVRLEAAMCGRRRWTREAFERLVRHPLVAWLAKRLIWQQAGGPTFRVAEDWTWADVDDRAWTLPDNAHVRLPHALEVPDELKARWTALLADYEIVPPFPQMLRPVFRPTPAEKNATEIRRVDGRPTTQAKLYGLRHRGWDGMADPEGTVMVKALPDDGSAVLEVADGRLGRVRVRGARLGALDPIVFSELVRELEWAALGETAEDDAGR